MADDHPTPTPKSRLVLLCLALVLAVGGVFGRTAGNGFIDYDDLEYVTANPRVASGLDLETALWALRTGQNSNWHPLTWISHTLDVTLFGLDPAGHHLVSVALHALSAVLLLLAFHRMTGALCRSAAVAALFALHPQHVESVAWAAERKDVLSTAIGMLCLLAYLRHVARPTRGTRIAVPVLLALGLMAKPMLVTLPFVFLLLDFWPLGRLGEGWRLVREKAPLFALAAASSVVTLLVQQRGGAVAALDLLPFPARVANAAVSYVTYLWRTFWPLDLGVLYPYATAIPSWKVAGSFALLAAITAGAVAARGRAPYVAMGWLWYLGTLVPVIGLVQVGGQATADRYTYLPLIGIFVILAWGLHDLAAGSRARRTALAGAAVVALALCAAATWRQIGYWRDSETLFERTLAVTSENYAIRANLGGTFLREDRLDEAIVQLEEARRIKPDHVPTLSNLGLALQGKGRVREGIELYREALRLRPEHVEAWLNLGNALEMTGDLDGAVAAFREGQRLRPDMPGVGARIDAALARRRQPPASGEEAARAARGQFDRGNSLRARGRLDEAEGAWREAVRLDPTLAAAHNNLAIALAIRGDADGAARHLSEVIRLDPRDLTARLNLATLLGRQGKRDEALARIDEVLRIDPANAEAIAARERLAKSAAR